MNISDSRDQAAAEDSVNVVSLFGSVKTQKEIVFDDPLATLLEEANIKDTLFTANEVKVRKVVSEEQFPDQSLYTLEEQLANLRKSINRIKFYLGDVEDLLPR